MADDKEKYVKLINETPLFSIDKDKQSGLYRKESLKLVENLYCYLLAVNREKNEPYGCEIVEVATRCINGYDGSGDFLHYFNSAWKKELSHIKGDEKLDKKFQGLKLTEQERRNVKKYLRIIDRCNIQMTESQKIEKVAELMELSVDEVKRLAYMSDIVVVGEYITNSEGEDVSTFDIVADDFLIEDYFENLSSLCEVLDTIEEAFANLQERQKPIVADMMTIRIADNLEEIEKLAKHYSFISDEMCIQIKKSGIIPTQRDIAEKYGKNEASISRTMKEFLNRFRGGIKCYG